MTRAEFHLARLVSCPTLWGHRIDSTDRLRVGGVFRQLQQAGSAVNFMKATYVEDEQPMRHVPVLTRNVKAGVEALAAQGRAVPRNRVGE